MGALVVNAWSTPDQVRGDEIADKERGQAERTSPHQRTLRNDVGYWTLADKAQHQQTAGNRQREYDQRVRQHVIAKRSPLTEQPEGQTQNRDSAVPGAHHAL